MSKKFNYQAEDLPNEIWVDIKGYEGDYMVSSLGRIKSLARVYKLNNHSSFVLHERIKKMQISRCGYVLVALNRHGRKGAASVHRLVAKNFIPNPDNLREVNHKNGIKWGNRVENLEWMSSSDNQIHAYKNGLQLSQKGERHGGAKLKESDVLKIRQLIKDGDTCAAIARQYKVSNSCILDIFHNRSWTHLLKAV